MDCIDIAIYCRWAKEPKDAGFPVASVNLTTFEIDKITRRTRIYFWSLPGISFDKKPKIHQQLEAGKVLESIVIGLRYAIRDIL